MAETVEEFLIGLTLNNGAQIEGWCTDFSASNGTVNWKYRNDTAPIFLHIPAPGDIHAVTVLERRERKIKLSRAEKAAGLV